MKIQVTPPPSIYIYIVGSPKPCKPEYETNFTSRGLDQIQGGGGIFILQGLYPHLAFSASRSDTTVDKSVVRSNFFRHDGARGDNFKEFEIGD